MINTSKVIKESSMIDSSGMIKASDLKVGDKIISTTGIEYEVIENHIGDVLFILNENGEGGHIYKGLHLFYDDIDYLLSMKEEIQQFETQQA